MLAHIRRSPLIHRPPMAHASSDDHRGKAAGMTVEHVGEFVAADVPFELYPDVVSAGIVGENCETVSLFFWQGSLWFSNL